MKVMHLTPADDLRNILNNLSEPATIYLAAGTYKQKVEIAADDVTIIGENRETTIITYDDFARKIHADGKEYNTFRTYTLLVSGERVKLENLTVENSNDDPETVGQCVALSVNAKSFSAENIILKSMQDTLFMYPFPDDLVVRYDGFIPKRQLFCEGCAVALFKDCKIYGTVDFIFGGAEAYFLNCDIISVCDDRKIGFIAAPCHHLVQEYGFYFIDCNLINGGAGEGEVYLARPWRDFGKCAFINCNVGNHVKAELFDKWNDTCRDKTARFAYYGLKTATPVSPVSWAKELDVLQVSEIINRCKRKFKEFRR